MALSRNLTNSINWVLDNLIPPFIRDSRLLMTPMFYFIYGKKYYLFMDFKSKAFQLSPEEMVNYYKNLSDTHIQRDTDLNTESIQFILNNLEGNSVLDISCGRGFLANKIVSEKKLNVTGVDFIIPEDLANLTNPKYIEASIEDIPFDDNSFDTVICTHTLEHIVDINLAIKELRRVCNNKLIVVVPRQRNYKYTFDLHVHFFPHKHSLLNVMGHHGDLVCLQNDWVYSENTTNL